ncbi:MAG: hypothetical protein QG673_446 [Pseudomonadota bacterium]|nr:hypothetical protein [Pseudomonadota bacterium]
MVVGFTSSSCVLYLRVCKFMSVDCSRPPITNPISPSLKTLTNIGKKKFSVFDTRNIEAANLPTTKTKLIFSDSSTGLTDYLSQFLQMVEQVKVGAASIENDSNRSNPFVNMSNDDFIKMVTNLFYSKDGLKLPKIYQLIMQHKNDDYSLQSMQILCKVISERISQIKIIKHNSVFKDEENFNLILKGHVDVAKEFIKDQISINEINDLNEEQLRSLVSRLMEEIGDFKEFKKNIKLGRAKDYKINASSNMAPLIAYGACSGSKASAPWVDKQIPTHDDIDAAELSSGICILTGAVAWMTYKSTQNGLDSACKHILGLKKNVLLQTVIRLNDKNYKFTKAQKKQIKYVLNIKRGTFLANMFTKNTHSYKAFRKIIKCILKVESDVTVRTQGLISAAADEHNNIVERCNITQDNATTSVDIKDKIKSNIKTRQFGQLINYINGLSEEDKCKIPQIKFRIGKFRGNLLTYWITQKDNIARDNMQQFGELIDTLYANESILNSINIEGLTKPSGEKYTLSNLMADDVNYDKFSQLIRTYEVITVQNGYEVINKAKCILDMTHIIYAIQRHSRLTDKEKDDLLIDYLKNEISLEDNGKFGNIRIKRNVNLERAGLGALLFNGRNGKAYANSVDPSATLPIIACSAGVGYAIYSTLSPLSEWFARGNTTTFKNVKLLIKHGKELPRPPIERVEHNLIEQQRIVSQNFESQSFDKARFEKRRFEKPCCEEPGFENMTIGEIKTELLNITNKIIKSKGKNNESVEQEITRLTDCLTHIKNNPSAKAYYILTDTVESGFLLDKLYRSVNKIPQLLPLLNEGWGAVNKLIFPEIHSLYLDRLNDIVLNQKQNLNESVSSPEEREEIELKGEIEFAEYAVLHEFKKIVAATSFDNAKSALLGFYKFTGIINSCKSESVKQEMLKFLTTAVYRAENDPTSNFYPLLKRTQIKELIIRALVRMFGALMVGAALAVTTTVPLALPIAMLIFILAGGQKGVTYALATNFTHATVVKTKEYKSAKKYLKLTGLKMDDDFFAQLKSLKKSCLNDEMVKISHFCKKHYKKNKKAEINVKIGDKSLTEYLEWVGYTKFPGDKIYVEQLKELSSKSVVDGVITGVGASSSSAGSSSGVVDAKNISLICAKVNEIIREVTSEIVDKHTANEAVFIRIMAICSAAIQDKNIRLQIILAIALLCMNRSIKPAEIISTDRSFYTQRNYLVADFAYGVFSSASGIVGAPAFDIFPIYQALISGSGIISSELSLLLGLNHNNRNNTKSYQGGMSFLKDIIIDLLISIKSDAGSEVCFSNAKLPASNNNKIKNEASSEVINSVANILDVEGTAAHILNTHTGRHWFTRVGKTTRGKFYYSARDN